MKDFNHINTFLEKFKKIIFLKEETKKIISQIIFDEINQKIDPESIEIKNGFIKIKGSSFLKNEIFIFKQKILKKIKENFKDKNFLDIV